MNGKKTNEILSQIDDKIEAIKIEESVNQNGLFRDGKTFSKQDKISLNSNVCLFEVSSSLMVPSIHLESLAKKLKKYRGFKSYLNYLLRKYKIHIVNGLIPSYANVQTKYQDKNQDLRKIGIRPWGSDWGELQLLRCSHGISMSAIFVYLLKVDCLEFAKTISEYLVKAGIPTVANLIFYGELSLEKERSLFSRIFRYKEEFLS